MFRKATRFCVILLLVPGIAFSQWLQKTTIEQVRHQVLQKDELFGSRFPKFTVNGRWTFQDKPNWFSGFLSGELWLLYQITGDSVLKQRALARADQLLPYAGLDNTHDMGFIFLPSCVKAYQLTGDQRYRQAALKAAEMLARRFNRKGNFIRAWGKLGTPDRAGWSIIDTMMNLELLFWAAAETGNSTYWEIAYRHALTCLREHIRPDGSSFHVVEFDPETGRVLRKFTHQGYSDSSTWARGQAWGIYGFVNAYRSTGDSRFLTVSKKMAEYFLSHLPPDSVPFWDLNLSGPDVPRDASAAAIAACGMFLLADQAKVKDTREKYQKAALELVRTLLARDMFSNSSRKQEQGVLLHCVYNFHKGWAVDESYPAGDYYFIEALKRLWDLQKRTFLLNDSALRQKVRWNEHWYYLQLPVKEESELAKVAHSWQVVNLPHTWNAEDATDLLPGYRRDASWYEKDLFVPMLTRGQRILLHFEGANLVTKVFANGRQAGEHRGGYVGFTVDLTPYLKYGQVNTIRVRVDNGYHSDLIPSQRSDFVIFGGLVGDVWLEKVPSLSLRKLQIRTPRVSLRHARTKVRVRSFSAVSEKKNVTLVARIQDSTGRVLLTTHQPVWFNPGWNENVLTLPVLEKPHLWSPDTPYLYTLEVQLRGNGQLLDRLSDRFGYRWFEFKKHGPFYLNGKRLLLRGTHRHEDFAGYGMAMPDSLQRRDLEQIKAMGAKFVRLAHYPQDPEVYRACDELGLLVWDELPWCRGGVGDEDWKENTERLLREQIEQNFNHPSIIIWSLGNEIYWLPERHGGGNVDTLRAFLSRLNSIAHQLDPDRLTGIRKFYEGADIVDVFSPSIWAGWYRGVYKNYRRALEDARKKYPRFLHMEYGAASHVGRHVEHPISGEGKLMTGGWEEEVNQVQVKNIARNGDWSESYAVDLFDWHIHVAESLPWFAGNAQWAFKDFPTPLRPENPIPFVNQKGLVDRAGRLKDAFYVFQSYWTNTPKFCTIISHTWPYRFGQPGQSREVRVYSNCSRVELFLNGKTLGSKMRRPEVFPAAGLTWQVKFVPGGNQLVAIGFEGRKDVARDTVELSYVTRPSGRADHIRLRSVPLGFGRFRIQATVVDKRNQPCLNFHDRLYFDRLGNGGLLANRGTPDGSLSIEAANGRAEILFYLPVQGKAVIEVRSQDLKGNYLLIDDTAEPGKTRFVAW